jgi:hypothetical protein
MKSYGPAHELLLTNSISEIDRARRKDRMWELRERAQGLVEYGLIIALVAVLAIAGLIIFGPAVSSLLSKLGGSV